MLGVGGRLIESASDVWRTPQKIADYWIERYNLKIDAAADVDSRKLPWHFGLDTHWWYAREKITLDALKIDWFSVSFDFIEVCPTIEPRFWCNPPYGRMLAKFVKKMREEQHNGCTTVALLPLSRGSIWFKRYCATDCLIFDVVSDGKTSGRIQFELPDSLTDRSSGNTRDRSSGNTRDSMFVVFAPEYIGLGPSVIRTIELQEMLK